MNTPPSTPPLTPPPTTSLSAHLEALNLAGLGFGASRLLGRDPKRVTNQFTMWARQDLTGLPSLTGPFWTALQPLDVGRPGLEAAAICDRLLVGRHGDAAAAVRAAEQCAAAGRDRAVAAPATAAVDEDPGRAAQRRALLKAVKEYWRGVGAVCGEMRSRVVTGEHDRAARIAHKAQVVLQPVVDRVAAAAAEVAGSQRTTVAPVPAATTAASDASMRTRSDRPVRPDPDQPPPARRKRQPRRQPTPLGDRTQAQARAEAFARAERIRADADGEAEQRPVEVLSTEPVRNHVFAPIVFLLVVAALALLVIFGVLNASNPLAQ